MVNNFRAVNSQQQQQSRRRRRPALRADDCEPLDTRTLEVAIRETAPRWRGQRNEKSAIGQAEITIKDLKAFHAAGLRGKQIAEAPALRVCDVSIKMLRAVVSQWLAKGLSPGSCHRRLSVLSVMGIDVRGARPPLGKALKWWLTPDLQADLTARLRSGALGCDDDEGEDCEDGLSVIVTPPMMAQEETPPITLQAGSFAFLQTIEAPPPIKERLTTASIDPILADFVDWTVWTGLRVEEFPAPSPIFICKQFPQRHRAWPKDPRKSGHAPHILGRYRPRQAHLRRFLRGPRDVPCYLSTANASLAGRYASLRGDSPDGHPQGPAPLRRPLPNRWWNATRHPPPIPATQLRRHHHGLPEAYRGVWRE